MRCWLALTVAVLLPALASADPVRLAAQSALQQQRPGTRLLHDGPQLTRLFGTTLGEGASPEQAAEAFVQAHAPVFGATPADLVPGSWVDGALTRPVLYEPVYDDYKFTLVYYQQQRGGLPVFRGELRLLVRNEPGHPIVLAASNVRDLGDFQVPAIIAIEPVALGRSFAAAETAAPGLVQYEDAEVVIWAGYGPQQATPTMALAFYADNGLVGQPGYERWLFVTDAATGAVLFQESQIHHVDVTGTVSGRATTVPKADICNPETVVPMPYARVNIGGTVVFADANGQFTVPNAGSTAVTVESPVRGQWFIVNNQAATTTTLSQVVTPPGPATFIHNDANTDELVRAEVNAYVQANTVRDFVLAYNPSYPGVFNLASFNVRVNINDTCNAYYDGTSINFYRSGGGCANTAFSGVVHHEYGHHLVNRAGSGQGQYGEGMSDCIALLIADNPVLGWGFQNNCNAGIRTAVNTLQYPCTGTIHSCGQLLSGAVWDTRNALVPRYPTNYIDVLAPLVINSILLHTGDLITPQITVDILTLDDDDTELSNGTPHYAEICAGFNAHSLTCPPLALLDISFPEGHPAFVRPTGGTRTRVAVTDLAASAQPGTLYLHVDTGDGYVANPLLPRDDGDYDAEFPAATCGDAVRYYISAGTTTGTTVTSPTDAPTATYACVAGFGLSVVHEDDFETDRGWTVGDAGDNASSGFWTRNVPQATTAQPGSDHTPSPGTQCWVTDYRAGTGAGSYDVDSGRTTLRSPAFDLSGHAGAVVSYWRWYSNDKGAGPNTDTFRVDITANGGASWTNVETVGPTGEGTGGGWLYHEFVVNDFVPASSTIQLRFIAEDFDPQSLVEAAVDDFMIRAVDCAPPFIVGDANCDGVVDTADIDAFVLALVNPAGYAAQYPACDLLAADCNGDGSVDTADIDAFVQLVVGG